MVLEGYDATTRGTIAPAAAPRAWGCGGKNRGYTVEWKAINGFERAGKPAFGRAHGRGGLRVRVCGRFRAAFFAPCDVEAIREL